MQDDCITISLGLPEVQVVRVEETEKEINVEVRYRGGSAPCPVCGARTPKVHSTRLQRKRDRRLREKGVFLVLHKRRFRCVGCGKVFTEPDPVFGQRRRSSRRFRDYLGREALDQPIRVLARKEGVGEGLVRGCVTELARQVVHPPEELPTPRVLGMDEFSIRKGQVYDTALMDVERKQVIGVVGGRGRQGVQGFLERLPEPDQVQVAVMDMHEPFRQAVEACLPQAKIVVDKFHVLRRAHWALDQVRLELQGSRRDPLYRSRFLLLRAAERLSPEGWRQLHELLDCFPRLRQAWALKEGLRLWYHSPTPQEAARNLALWEQHVRQVDLAPFRALFPWLRRWRKEILNYFDHRYTNGFVEGKNNRIKVIKRVGFGYRNPHNFRLRVLLTNVKEALPNAA